MRTTWVARRGGRARLSLLAAAVLAACLAGVSAPGPARASAAQDFIWVLDQTASGELEGVADLGRFRLFDADLSPELSAMSVQVTSTSDPVGVSVVTVREARAGYYYFGSVRFTQQAAAGSDALHVADGDTVTVVYRDAAGSLGVPEVVEASTRWRAQTRPPDWRGMALTDPADGPATIRGAQDSAPPDSTVRVYDPSGDGSPLLSGAADAAGRFRLPAPGDLPELVELTAQEPGLPESPRMPLQRSPVSARVVLPDGGPGLLSAVVELRQPSCEGDGCVNVWLTDADGYLYDGAGRWGAPPIALAGDYDLTVGDQGTPSTAPWQAGAYGDPPPTRVTVDTSAGTVDLGTLVLLPPVFEAQVQDSDGAPVVEAAVTVYDVAGEPVSGGYTRRDGRVAVYRPDGDYRVQVRGPLGCAVWTEASGELSIRDGQPTPSTATYVIDPLRIQSQDVEIPVQPVPTGVTVRLDGPGVELRLQDVTEPGTVTVGCLPDLGEDAEVVTPPVDLDWDAEFGAATVCLSYPPGRLAADGVAESDLQLLHRTRDGALESIATEHDLEQDRLCGETAGFSPFGVGVPQPARGAVPQARAIDDSCPEGRVPEDGFTDVAAGDLHEPAIDCVRWWQVASGRSATQYAPGETVTRGQMATFLLNVLQRSGGQVPTTDRDWFSDDDGHRHEDSINRLAAAGVVVGRGDGRYGPDLAVPRDAMATFLVRTHEERTGEPLPAGRDWFSDDDTSVHAPSIDRAAEAGLTGGAGGGGYAPAADVRRNAMASFLSRLLDLLVEHGHGAPPA